MTTPAPPPERVLPEIESETLIATADRLARDGQLWLTEHSSELLIAAAVGAVIFLGLGACKRLAARHIRNNPDYIGFRAVLLRMVAKTSKLFMLLLAAEVIVLVALAPPSVRETVHFLFTIAAVLQGAIWLRELVLGALSNKLRHDPEQHETLESAISIVRLLVTFVIFAIAAIVILDNLGVNVTGLVAGLGVGGIAIGLAAQGIFSDLFAALSIIFDKPFRRGDVIHYDDTTGVVRKIGLKSTRLRSITGEQLIISNTNLLDKEITNWNRMEYRRQRLSIGVIYQTAPEEARRIPGLLQEVVEAHGATFVRAGFVGFGDSAINFEVDFDFADTDYDVMFAHRHRIGLAIVERFAAEGFEFAYPTQTTFTAAPDGEMIMPYPKDGFPVQIEEAG